MILHGRVQHRKSFGRSIACCFGTIDCICIQTFQNHAGDHASIAQTLTYVHIVMPSISALTTQSLNQKMPGSSEASHTTWLGYRAWFRNYLITVARRLSPLKRTIVEGLTVLDIESANDATIVKTMGGSETWPRSRSCPKGEPTVQGCHLIGLVSSHYSQD